MTSHHGTHTDLHSEQGALPAEHPGRAKNPVIKVLDLAWLEFVKPDLDASERFAHAFGFTTVSRTTKELQLRGTDGGAPCVLVRRGPRSRYLGAAFRAADSSDLLRLADATGTRVEKLPASIGGLTVRSEEHTSELQSHSDLHSFPTRRSSDLRRGLPGRRLLGPPAARRRDRDEGREAAREHRWAHR